jgi:hypothetical protein
LAILTPIKQDIQRFFAQRIKLPKHQPGFFHDLNNPVSLGLFFCVKTLEELEEVRTLLNLIKKSHKKVSALVFYPGYETLDVITHKSISLFDLTDFTLFGKMKDELKTHLTNERFEMMISFAVEPGPFCKLLVSELRADFKIGPEAENTNEFYDLTLTLSGEKANFLDFYDQVKHYLSVLNIKAG